MDSSVPTKRKGSSSQRKRRRKGSCCQQDGDSQAAKVTSHSIPQLLEMDSSEPTKRKGSSSERKRRRKDAKVRRQSIPELPEDILGYIHCLMPMREAARAACVSRAFLRSWRGRPNLIFDEHMIDLKTSFNVCREIDAILRNHSGIGVKVFKLICNRVCRKVTSHYLDSWIQVALKPGIEEITLMVDSAKTEYNFPCSVLSDGIRSSIRYLKLGSCGLHPAAELGPLRSLTTLYLWCVSISGDELESLLSNCPALEKLELYRCLRIIWLEISCALEQLSSLRIYDCWDLKMIENNAPNLSRFFVRRDTKFSLGKALQTKKLDLDCPYVVHYARAKLPSIVPNLETLVIGSDFVDLHSIYEEEITPMLPSKFFCLKHLTVGIRRSYDFLSLVSFLDASPSLETLTLNVIIIKKPTLRDDSQRHMPEHRHGCLKCVNISKFFDEKSLVELTRYILMYAVSLECLTLDTVHGHHKYHLETSRRCPIADWALTAAHRALWAIKTYIEYKVPASVKLTVLKPCSQCHGGDHCKLCNV